MARRRWPWFMAWCAVGAAYALSLLGAMTIGIFVLPFAVGATIWLVTRRGATVGVAGLVSGLGLPFLYVAYLNREGPGNVCRTFARGSGCTEEMNPLPWLALGLGFLVAGVVLSRRAARPRTTT